MTKARKSVPKIGVPRGLGIPLDVFPGDLWIYLFDDGRVLYGKNAFRGPHWRSTLVLRVRDGEVTVVKDRRVTTPIVAKKDFLGPAIRFRGLKTPESDAK